MTTKTKKAVAHAIVIVAVISICLHFIYTAIQGNSGWFRRIEIEAGEKALLKELEKLNSQIEIMENLTRRLSDDYLDIDLLDEQARKMLGLMRSDEIVIR